VPPLGNLARYGMGSSDMTASPPKPKPEGKATPISASTDKRLRNLKPFKSGAEWTGNKAGRPKGSRNKINEEFLAALCEDFELHGKEVIVKVREERPDVYLKVVASLQPKEIDVRERTIEDLSDQEIFEALAEIRALRSRLETPQKKH
jgi:hypothetical protein